jgi:hypothetical protein
VPDSAAASEEQGDTRAVKLAGARGYHGGFVKSFSLSVMAKKPIYFNWLI